MIEPDELPRLRNRLLDDTHRHLLTQVYTQAIASGQQRVRPTTGTPAEAGALMANRELDRLAAGRLFYVDRDVTRDCLITGETTATINCSRSQIPVDFGFAYFAETLGVNNSLAEGQVWLRACSWGLWPDAPKVWPEGGLWITWYTDRDLDIETAVDPEIMELRAEMSSAAPELLLETETQVPFTDEPLSGLPDIEPDSVYGRATRALFALWGHLNEKTATVTTLKPSRPLRRQSERSGAEDASVTVITS